MAKIRQSRPESDKKTYKAYIVNEAGLITKKFDPVEANSEDRAWKRFANAQEGPFQPGVEWPEGQLRMVEAGSAEETELLSRHQEIIERSIEADEHRHAQGRRRIVG